MMKTKITFEEFLKNCKQEITDYNDDYLLSDDVAIQDRAGGNIDDAYEFGYEDGKEDGRIALMYYILEQFGDV